MYQSSRIWTNLSVSLDQRPRQDLPAWTCSLAFSRMTESVSRACSGSPSSAAASGFAVFPQNGQNDQTMLPDIFLGLYSPVFFTGWSAVAVICTAPWWVIL